MSNYQRDELARVHSEISMLHNRVDEARAELRALTGELPRTEQAQAHAAYYKLARASDALDAAMEHVHYALVDVVARDSGRD